MRRSSQKSSPVGGCSCGVQFRHESCFTSSPYSVQSRLTEQSTLYSRADKYLVPFRIPDSFSLAGFLPTSFILGLLGLLGYPFIQVIQGLTPVSGHSRDNQAGQRHIGNPWSPTPLCYYITMSITNAEDRGQRAEYRQPGCPMVISSISGRHAIRDYTMSATLYSSHKRHSRRQAEY